MEHVKRPKKETSRATSNCTSPRNRLKVYDQNLQRCLTFYDKRMNKPLQVNVVKPAVPEEEEKPQGEQIEEKLDGIETDICDSVPATMKSRAIKKVKANKDIIGWNEQGQMVFKVARYSFQKIKL